MLNFKNTSNLHKYVLGLVIVWSTLYVTGLGWEVFLENRNTVEIARMQARIAFEKDTMYRRWVAMHGGVYVPVTEDTQPNPFLSGVHERDVTTASNRRLTLINPDYMIRQINKFIAKDNGIEARTTSRHPTRKENVPDTWEENALEQFDKGETEISSILTVSGKEHMRLIRPLIAGKNCTQCHTGEEYLPGNISGGLSVAVPMEELRSIEVIKIIHYALLYTVTWTVGLIVIFLAGKKLLKNDEERKLTEERMAIQHTELQTTTLNLQALYKVSSALSQTIDMESMLAVLLETITTLDLFDVQHKGGIFLVEGDRMELVSHLGHDKEFLDKHKNMKVGTCLCGLAAANGKIIVSENCNMDSRHTITLSGMTPHGHIIVPLKALSKVVGILYLYLPPDIKIDQNKIDLLLSIGNQAGTAIENSRLFKETRELSLHDHLTALANRRFMDIVMKRCEARAKRTEGTFAVIMLDIDDFKEYNDNYGHARGDKILVGVAKVLLCETREMDLAVRYGGEEFLVLLPETDMATAAEIAERIRASVHAETGVTVSLGISSYTLDMEREQLIKNADTALYQAKQKGKNRVELSA